MRRCWLLLLLTGPLMAATADMPMVVMDGRAYVPVRPIADWLGANVDWDDATQETSLAWQGKALIFGHWRTHVTANSRQIILEAPTMQLGEEGYVPARFLADHLNLPIGWHPETSTLTLYDSVKERSLELPATHRILSVDSDLNGDGIREHLYQLARLNPASTSGPAPALWVRSRDDELASMSPVGSENENTGAALDDALLTMDLTGDGKPEILTRWGSEDATGKVVEWYVLGWHDKGGLTNLIADSAGRLIHRTPGALRIIRGKPATLVVWQGFRAQGQTDPGQYFSAIWYKLTGAAFGVDESRVTEKPYNTSAAALKSIGL